MTKLILILTLVLVLGGCELPIEGKCKVCDAFGMSRPDPDSVHPDKPDPIVWEKEWGGPLDKKK